MEKRKNERKERKRKRRNKKRKERNEMKEKEEPRHLLASSLFSSSFSVYSSYYCA